MEIKAAEISSVIKDQIANFETKADVAGLELYLVSEMVSHVYTVSIKYKLVRW